MHSFYVERNIQNDEIKERLCNKLFPAVHAHPSLSVICKLISQLTLQVIPHRKALELRPQAKDNATLLRHKRVRAQCLLNH